MRGAGKGQGKAVRHTISANCRMTRRTVCGIICPVGECEPQAKHEPGGIDTMFLSEHERYAKCAMGNIVCLEQRKIRRASKRVRQIKACPPVRAVLVRCAAGGPLRRETICWMWPSSAAASWAQTWPICCRSTNCARRCLKRRTTSPWAPHAPTAPSCTRGTTLNRAPPWRG